jgi:hypothetical protein
MPGVYPAMGPIMRPNGDDEPRTQDVDLDALTAIRRSHYHQAGIPASGNPANVAVTSLQDC